MFSDVEQYLHYRIANATVLNYPYPHFYISEIFPPEIYATLIQTLPDQSVYKRLDETGTVPKGAYPERFVCDLHDASRVEAQIEGRPGPWSELARLFDGPQFAHWILSAFNDAVLERFGKDCELEFEPESRLVRDFSNYAISPHTDSPSKVVSLLFYMPPDDSMKELGTSIFVAKDPSFRCEGRAHHSFKNFTKVVTAAYAPNSLFAFFKTDRAFHGVERIERPSIQRDSLLYNIYVRNVGRRPAAEAASGTQAA
jgi:hypothetical protein